METKMLLVSLTILTAISNVVAFKIRQEIQATDASSGPLSLVQATKQAVEYLGEPRTGAQAKIVLQGLIDRATVLLQGSDVENVSLPVSVEIQIHENDTIYEVAVLFNHELALLSRYADYLNEAVVTGDSNEAAQIILAIRDIADLIIFLIDYTGINIIEYHDRLEDEYDIGDIDYHDPTDYTVDYDNIDYLDQNEDEERADL